MAKARATTQVYQLKIALDDIRPPIWRRIQTPDCDLCQLHRIIQFSMGWDSYHLWEFKIGGEQFGPSEDELGMDTFGMDESQDAGSVRLSDLVKAGYKKFRYTYDFGDGWRHTLTLEKVEESECKLQHPRCIKGKRACPPEDCGGPWDYGTLLEVINDPKHPEHQELSEWVGGSFDPEACDLDQINTLLKRA